MMSSEYIHSFWPWHPREILMIYNMFKSLKTFSHSFHFLSLSHILPNISSCHLSINLTLNLGNYVEIKTVIYFEKQINPDVRYLYDMGYVYDMWMSYQIYWVIINNIYYGKLWGNKITFISIGNFVWAVFILLTI
jgi:hypothetical protein